MVFSSIEFLFYFLPFTILLYFIAPRALKNAVLAAASLLFYSWGGGRLVLLLLLSIVLNYALGLLAFRARRSGGLKKLTTFLCIAVNLSLLGYFKYAGFFLTQLNITMAGLGLGTLSWPEIVLPIGISFYTFQAMSYVFDVLRGVSAPLRNPVNFALYVSSFPQLIAGPIVRYHLVADQIFKRSTSFDNFSRGAVRFSFGLAKKVIIADSAGVIAETAFALPAGSLSSSSAWIGVFAYSVQIYFDFSGYSDMAIGLGRIFGFTFPENFNRPYSSLSITDFWRRWHITLSNWFRDYLYIPLGGSRVGPWRLYANLFVIFFLVGLWHGARWTFIVWGAYHGGLLLLERITGQRCLDGASWRPLRRGAIFFLVLLGWVLFRAESLAHAFAYYGAMFSFDIAPLHTGLLLVLSTKSKLALVVGASVLFIPPTFNAGLDLMESPRPLAAAVRLITVALLLPYTALVVVSGTFSPFIYFQF